MKSKLTRFIHQGRERAYYKNLTFYMDGEKHHVRRHIDADMLDSVCKSGYGALLSFEKGFDHDMFMDMGRYIANIIAKDVEEFKEFL